MIGVALLRLRNLGIEQYVLAIDLHGPGTDSRDLRQVFMQFERTGDLAVLDDGDRLGDAYALQLG